MIFSIIAYYTTKWARGKHCGSFFILCSNYRINNESKIPTITP